MYVKGPALPPTSTVMRTVSPLRYWVLSKLWAIVIPALEFTTNVSVAKAVTALFATPSARTRNDVPSGIDEFSWNTWRRLPLLPVRRFEAPYPGITRPVDWSVTAMSTSTPAAPGLRGFGGKSVTFALTSTVTIPPGSYVAAATFVIIRRPSIGALATTKTNRSAFERVVLNQACARIWRFVGIVPRSVNGCSPLDPVNMTGF